MVRYIFVSALAFVSLGLLGCCDYGSSAQAPLSVPQGSRDGTVEVGEKNIVLTPECDREIPKVSGGMVLSDPWRAELCKRAHRKPRPIDPAMAEVKLAEWKNHPDLVHASCDGHVQGSKQNNVPGGHVYIKVSGLPECARILCSFRPGCYEQIVKDTKVGKKGNDEECVDPQTCRYLPDEPPESMDQCFESIPKTAGSTEEF